MKLKNMRKQKMENELKDLLLQKYNINAEKVEKNLQSTIGNVYIVYSKNIKYVIKIYDNVEHTNAMVSLHKVMDEQNLYVPKVIYNIKNEPYTTLANQYIVVYSFLQGHQIVWDTDKIKLSDAEIDGIAKTLRILHNIKSNEMKLPVLSFGNDVKRKSVLHFDLTRNNIFIDQTRIGIIDFDDAKFGASVCDVAILIANLFFSKSKGANLEGMRKFIDAYYWDVPDLKKDESPRIKEFALMWIEYVLSGNEFDSSTTESFEARKVLINRYL